MNETAPASKRNWQWILLEFLGSMNLAITLLVVVAVASVIGTVLQQNQPYPDYVLKFGPFWFSIFKSLGLYDVYGSGWFVGILSFLILSTSVCVYRHTPIMWREMTQLRTKVRLESLRGFHQHAEWRLEKQHDQAVLSTVGKVLDAAGYHWRSRAYNEHHIIAAVKGRYNRLGYMLTHVAIIVIGVGGLLDGNIWLKLKEWNGSLRVETRDLTASAVPAASRLSPSAAPPAFRGNIMLPEGSPPANFIFLQVRDGFVVQELPFAIELKDFQVDYYPTGQPKSFASDVLIHDQEYLGDKPLAATIRVNHPLVYRGYAIYQANFGDGGSKLALRAWPLTMGEAQAVEVQAKVGTKLALGTAPLTLELDDFRIFNLIPEDEDKQPNARQFRNFGPSMAFKLRDATGVAREYFNYMLPVEIDGRWFFISGMRNSAALPFSYLHIPADAQHSPERFLRFNARLRDSAWLRQFFTRSNAENTGSELERNLNLVRLSLLDLVVNNGFSAVEERAKAIVPAERLQDATTLYLNLVQESMAQVFVEILREEGINVEQGVDEQQQRFFNDALLAIANLKEYTAPFYLQLSSFEQIEASGLQVTRSSGAFIVYLGFALLTAGVFIMFYSAYRRIWAWVSEADGIILLVLAGTVNRQHSTFNAEFARITAVLDSNLSNGTA